MQTHSSVEISPGDRLRYCTAYSQAVEVCRDYDGREGAYQTLLKHLIVMDKALCSIAKLEPGKSVSPEFEELICSKLIGPNARPATITGIIDLALSSVFFRAPIESSPLQIASALKILCKVVAGNFVPPLQTIGVTLESTGEPSKYAPSNRWIPRIQTLITKLQDRGIYTDDLILTVASSSGSQWRCPGYSLIEIPRLGYAQIFLSNQVGEGTRISAKPTGIDTYKSATKAELDRISGVSTVVCHSIDQWIGTAMKLLDFHTVSTKIPVELVEKVRNAVLQNFTAPEYLACGWESIRHILADDSSLEMIVPQILPAPEYSEENYHQMIFDIVYGHEKREGFEPDSAREPTFTGAVDYSKYDGNWKETIRAQFPRPRELISSLNEAPDNRLSTSAGQLLFSCGLALDLTKENWDQILNQIYPDSYSCRFRPNKGSGRPNLKFFQDLLFDVIRQAEFDLISPLKFHRTLLNLELLEPKTSHYARAARKIAERFGLELKDQPIYKPPWADYWPDMQDEIKDILVKGNRAVLTSEENNSLTHYCQNLTDQEAWLQTARHDLNEIKKVYEALVKTRMATLPEYSRVTYTTPIGMDPNWNLSRKEKEMLQLLLNNGDGYVLFDSLHAQFDPEATNIPAIIRGPIIKMADSINRALQAAGVPYIIERHPEDYGLRFSYKRDLSK